MLLGDGGSLLKCRRNARWTETTDPCFTNCSTQNAFCSRIAVIAVLRHRPREKRGVGLRMNRKLEHLLFRSMWEILLCMRFQSRDGRLKTFQSFWYTLYVWIPSPVVHVLNTFTVTLPIRRGPTEIIHFWYRNAILITEFLCAKFTLLTLFSCRLWFPFVCPNIFLPNFTLNSHKGILTLYLKELTEHQH